MKRILNMLCAVIVAGGLWQGAQCYGQWQGALTLKSSLESKLSEITAHKERLARFKSQTAGTVEETYDNFLNDVVCIARVHRLGLSIESAQPAFRSSVLPGLREARVKVVFARISRRAALVSLLAALDQMAFSRAFLAEKITQDKDALAMELVLFGI